MRKITKGAAAIAAASLAGAAMATPAAAYDHHPSGIRIGVLTCSEAPGWGYVLGSSRGVRCNFSPEHRVSERYSGEISKFGVDIGYKHSATMVWAVFAPTDHVEASDLAGHYGGLTASATVGVGLGANAMIGGSNRTISLQPLSVEGNTGLDVAAGIGALSLHYIPHRRAYRPAAYYTPIPRRTVHRHCQCS